MGKKRNKKKAKAIGSGNEHSLATNHSSRTSWQFIKRHWVAAATIISLIIGIIPIGFYIKDKKINAQSGVILSSGTAQKKYVSLGGGSVPFLVNSSDGVFLRDGANPVVTFSIKNGKLLITTTIRDSSGAIIAELVNNEWMVNKQNAFDRNYNDKALEVRDQFGKVVLQVADFGDTIYLAGIFHTSWGRTVVIAPAPQGGAYMSFYPSGEEPSLSIQPIFEYPSERHLGSSPGISSLERLIVHAPCPAFGCESAIDIGAHKKQ